MKKLKLFIILMSIGLCSYAQTEAITTDGRKALLNDDGTYTWVEVESTKEATNETVLGDYFIGKHIDEMTDEAYYYPSQKLVCLDKSEGIGFALNYQYDGKTDNANAVKIGGLSVKVIGLECLEDTELLFLFDDNSKLTLKSWNKFNCKGNAWYELTSSQLKEISSKTIKKLRVENGRNYKTYTHELEGDDKSYLINMNKCVENKDIRAKQIKD